LNRLSVDNQSQKKQFNKLPVCKFN